MYTPKKHFIFDLDGTLCDTIGDITLGLNLTMKEYGFPEISRETAIKSINRGARELVRGVMPRELSHNEDFVSEFLSSYSRNYSKVYLETTCLYPLVSEGIEYLKASGAKLAVYSNKQDAQVTEICKKLFPPCTFDITMGHSGSFQHKPNPSGALYIASIFGCQPSDAVIVGDSDIDMKLADNAGMHKVGVSWGYRPSELLLKCGAEAIIYDLYDFKRLI